jgi:16S rRNA (uracil1498-N3)-methyltransferase
VTPVFVAAAADLVSAGVGSTVRLTGPEGRHAVTVRRIGPGESVSVVDGAGRRVLGSVSAVIDRQSLDIVVSDVADEPPEALRFVVVQALAKGDRGELAVELLTEIGVDEIVPWSAENCVAHWRGDRVAKSWQRWADAAVAAAKQSRRARFPVLAPLAATAEVEARVAGADLAVVLHESAEASIGSLQVPDAGEVLLVVGPEGGISPAELATLAAAGAHIVRLGPSVLRTSSAGMAAVAVLAAGTARWSVATGDGTASTPTTFVEG